MWFILCVQCVGCVCVSVCGMWFCVSRVCLIFGFEVCVCVCCVGSVFLYLSEVGVCLFCVCFLCVYVVCVFFVCLYCVCIRYVCVVYVYVCVVCRI